MTQMMIYIHDFLICIISINELVYENDKFFIYINLLK